MDPCKQEPRNLIMYVILLQIMIAEKIINLN